MTPYLSGDFMLGKADNYALSLKIPVRVHLTQFDVLINTSKQTAVLDKLKTSVEVFDRKGGKLLPWATGLKVGITKGGATEGAAAEIQKSANEMIAKAFADARTKSKATALEKFPLAALFIDGAK
jgi:hypothetical protein